MTWAGLGHYPTANPFDFERWAVSLIGGQPHQRAEQAGDKGVDGWIRFPVTDREISRAIISVERWATIQPGNGPGPTR
ncbi:MAG: hypothetical protein M3O70_19675, partial [Actinomycetota bacterium]|nr:hypothetical protein [Actinomycetota bacterium]